MITALVVLLVLDLILLYRNQLIYKYRTRALDLTSQKATCAINKGDPWRLYHDAFDECGTYERMLFDITRWRYAAFYPHLQND